MILLLSFQGARRRRLSLLHQEKMERVEAPLMETMEEEALEQVKRVEAPLMETMEEEGKTQMQITNSMQQAKAKAKQQIRW